MSVLTRVVEEVIRFATAAERIHAAVLEMKHVGDRLLDLAKHDPELHPEIEVAATHLALAVEALTRAHTFADARLDARLAGESP